MAHVIYRGPHEAVDVGGSGLIAERDGEPVKVPAEIAEALAESDLWKVVGSIKVTKAELVDRAEALGLSTTGTKAELEERIAQAETGAGDESTDDDEPADEPAEEE